MVLDYAAFQRAHKEWVDREYPDQRPWMPAAGMVEEGGELMRAMLKLDQIRKYGMHPRDSIKDWDYEFMDAIGDCAIYVCSLCNANRWDFEDIARVDIPVDEDWTMSDLAAELVHNAATVVKWNSKLHTIVYFSLLRRIAKICNVNFEQCIEGTWQTVSQRNRSQPCV